MTSLAAPTDVAVESRWWRTPRAMPWWRIPLYPAALSSALVVMIWGHAGLDLDLLFRPLIAAATFGLGLTLALAAIVRDRDRGAMLATIVVLMLLVADDRLAIVLAIGASVVLVEGIVRRGRPTIVARTATKVLTAIGVILIVALSIDLAQFGAIGPGIKSLMRPALPAPGAAASTLPDVYLFLLDGYPGDRAARQSQTFDRESFPAALTARGFDVVRDAHSNYLLTPLTLASMLWMQHVVDIPELDPPHGPVVNDWRRLRVALDDAPAFSMLREAGYETVVIDPGYGHTRLHRVDRFVDSVGPQELELSVIQNTRLGELLDVIAPGALAEAARARINGTFDSVRDVSSEPHDRPRFVFVHVAAPHPPWVFDSDGSPRQPLSVSFGGEPGLSKQDARDAGYAQAAYVARLTEQAIDEVIEASPQPPVIVVMSDHGPGDDFDGGSSLTSDLEVRASNFMAALTPDHPGLMTSRPSPVNLFPTIFSAYLGWDIERQPDTIWGYRESILDGVEAPPIEGWTK